VQVNTGRIEKLSRTAESVQSAANQRTLRAPPVNERLGRARARAVQRYLHERHRIPLHKMDVISYGEAAPIAPNTTAAGRAENRRVEIKVMS
jgi:outer membrane protein OmpA-like peptidoglycan-associated protein